MVAIYKYPFIKQLFETAIGSDNSLFNSHIQTIREFYEIDPKHTPETICFTSHSSNFALDIMIQNANTLIYINAIGLSLNMNPNIGALLEIIKHKLTPWDYQCFSESENPAIMNFLEKNLDKINWKKLSWNSSPGSIKILENNLDKIVWRNLSNNSSAIHILKAHPDKIYWRQLCKNPNAIDLIEQNMDKVNWSVLSTNPNAIHILKNNLNKVNWDNMSINPGVVKMLDKVGFDKIIFTTFLRNIGVIDYLETNLDLLTIDNVYEKMKILIQNNNPKCIGLIDKIHKLGYLSDSKLKKLISKNIYNINKDGIYELDYQTMNVYRLDILDRGLILAEALHPDRIGKYICKENNIDWI